MSPGKKKLVARVFPLVFIVIGAVTGFLGIRRVIKADASTDWPTVPGKIVESSVERHWSNSGNGGSSRTYHAKVSYEYTVDGKQYKADRVAFGDYGSSDSSHARSIVDRYPEGKNVTVHYLPENPEEAVLEPGAKAQAWSLNLHFSQSRPRNTRKKRNRPPLCR